MKTATTRRLSAVVWQEDDLYASACPEVGVVSCGGTVKKAVDNLKEAVQLYLETMTPEEAGDAFHATSEPILTTMTVSPPAGLPVAETA